MWINLLCPQPHNIMKFKLMMKVMFQDVESALFITTKNGTPPSDGSHKEK